jgi:hypothetical protein
LRLEKAEALHNGEFWAELKELKESIFVDKDENGTDATSNGEGDVKGNVNGVVNMAGATSSKAKSAKLAKLAKLCTGRARAPALSLHLMCHVLQMSERG